MPKYGLGRGLESLIPSYDESESDAEDTPAHKATDQQADVAVPRAPRTSRARVSVSETANSTTIPTSDPIPAVPRGEEPFQNIPLDQIRVNPYQPRKFFEPGQLEEMKNSIIEHGILEPIVVTKVDNGYELIAGERRTQAARLAGLTTIPALVRKKATDQQKLEWALIENVQRTDLNPIERARAFKKFIHEFGVKQEDIAKSIGKSRVYITNTMHLLDLPVELQKALEDEVISEGHGRAILMIKSQEKQREAFEKIKARKLSVRQTEDLARAFNDEMGLGKVPKNQAPLDAAYIEKQRELQQLFGTKVMIIPKARGGKIVIDFFSREDLDVLSEKLSDSLS